MGEKDSTLELKNQAVDYVAAGVRAALGPVPIAGPLLTEIATAIIPRQRIDRIADFAARLNERIESLEQGKLAAAMDDEEFTDLVEEAMRQAARSTSDERRAYLASLVANSLTSDAVKHAESRHLIRILGELNDIEVLWLRFYSNPMPSGDEQFRELHADVFEPKVAYINSSRNELDQEALQESYRAHLLQLNLIKQELSTDRNGLPEVDKFSKDFKYRYRRTSVLGELLLRSIGMFDDEQARS